ncbi:MAG: alanine racemase [Actinomycetota bacterium]|nr:alanine racemase [Actinomycetota bacterium]
MVDRLRPVHAEINIGNLIHNYDYLSALATGSRICAVVKADAYGHGAVEVARALYERGCRDFAVALVEEGVELRRAGVDGEILVLSQPPLDALSTAAQYQISVTAYTKEAINAILSAAGEDRPSFQLKVDTGMYRVGVAFDDLEAIVNLIGPGSIDGLWSHFAVADEDSPESVEFTLLQLARFRSAIDTLTKGGLAPSQLHIGNSSGLLYYPQSRLTKSRVGLALYGYAPKGGSVALELRPVMSLISEVAFIKEVEEGERPSYGRRKPMARRGNVATVPIGYADGVPRRLFDGDGKVAINGRRYPFAGVITMDQILIDVGVSESVEIGDRVTLIGSDGPANIGADEWAARCNTITWEILCGISKRVPRIYLG